MQYREHAASPSAAPITHLWVGGCHLLQDACWCTAELPQGIQRAQQLIRQVGVLTKLLLKALQLLAKLQLLVVSQRLIHATSRATLCWSHCKARLETSVAVLCLLLVRYSIWSANIRQRPYRVFTA